MTKRMFSYCHGYLFFLLVAFALTGCGGGGSANGDVNGDGGADTGSGNNSATLTWEPPTTNADGTPLIDLAGYKVNYGTSSGNYTTSIDVGSSSCQGIEGQTECTHTVEDLSPGTYYFAITAYDTSGNEGDYSNEVSKSVE